jgi:hypothetical protein
MFEGFGKKIVAKVHEMRETGKAEESMTEEQTDFSRERQRLYEELKGSGIEVGDDLKIERVEGPLNGSYQLYHYSIKGTISGHRTQFWFTSSEFPVLADWSIENIRCAIDGEPISREGAEKTLEHVWEVVRKAHWLKNNDMGPLHNFP